MLMDGVIREMIVRLKANNASLWNARQKLEWKVDCLIFSDDTVLVSDNEKGLEHIYLYLYTLAVSPSWGVADNTKRQQKQWGFYSVLLAMMRDPAKFVWCCWSNTEFSKLCQKRKLKMNVSQSKALIISGSPE